MDWIKIICLSEKRKQAILTLSKQDMDKDSLLNILDGNTSSKMVQLKILEEHNLIEQKDGNYGLTSIGNLIINKMTPVIELLEVLESNVDYWKTRDLNVLPQKFLDRLGELREIEITEPNLERLFELNEAQIIDLEFSNIIYALGSFFNPTKLQTILNLSDNLKGELIVTQSVYNKFTTDYKKEYMQILNSNINIYTCTDEDVPVGSIIVTGDLTSIFLYNLNNQYDNKYILSRDKSSLNWAMDLFDYYKQKSQLMDRCSELEKLELKVL